MELEDIRKLDKHLQLQHLTEEQMEKIPLDELQSIFEESNKSNKIDNKEFENFEVLLYKDINITEVNKED